VAATVIVTRLALSSRRRGDRAASSWTGAAVALTDTFLPLAAYFARANTRLLGPTLPAAALTTELRRWQRWNMARAALAVGALAASVNAARHTLPR
jgi:ABC-type Fe3+ transport system permease subunit